MTQPSLPLGTRVVIQPPDLQALFAALQARGYRVIGPTLRDGAIVLDEIQSSADLPVGWTDVYDAGRYRVERRADDARFGYNTGPHAWKRYLNPPSQRVWQARLKDGLFKAFEIIDEPAEGEKLAFVGVRPCDLYAIRIMDKVFMQSTYVDPGYKARREKVLIVAADCTQAGATCFCTSMKTGPRADLTSDLALTEVIEDKRHFFVARAGSEAGNSVLAEIPQSVAGPADLMAAVNAVERAAGQIRRRLETSGLKELLQKNYDNPIWEQIGNRCLSCANCTLVCPTCFCSTVEDTTDLTGTISERWRKWDSCFSLDYSYIHGGSIRTSVSSRYRQWMMHKLATWSEQFETPGCVGCGRCIAWCPVAIDITEQARCIQEGTPA